MAIGAPPRRPPARVLLVLPGLVLGGIAIFALNDLYATAFGGDAAGQLAIPGLLVAGVAGALGIWRWWGRWLGGGLVLGAGVAAAGLLALFSMFPSAATVTDKDGARLADQHLDQLEQTPEFLAAPAEFVLQDSTHRSGCSDWFDRREPVTWRQYESGGRSTDDTVAFFGQKWEAAGYRPADGGNMPNYFVWHRDVDGWTASLSVFIDGGIVEVSGRDLDSHACK